MNINETGRNYFHATKSAFESFVGTQASEKTLADVQDAIYKQYGDNLPEDGIVIFEYTNSIEKQVIEVPKPKFKLTSVRKLGPRAPKADAVEGENPAAEGEAKPRKPRKSAAAPAEEIVVTNS